MNFENRVQLVREASDEILGWYCQPAFLSRTEWADAMEGLTDEGHEHLDPQLWRMEGIYPPIGSADEEGLNVAHLCPEMIVLQAPDDLEGMYEHVYRLLRREVRFLEEVLVSDDAKTCQLAAEEG